MFFLYGPFCLLAAGGLGWLASAAGRAGGEGARRAVLVLAGVGVAASILAIARLHPQQQAYFNLLVDGGTPGYARSQYTMDYWGHPYLEALRHLLERRPEGTIALGADTGGFADMEPYRLTMLPEADRRRFVFTETPEFRVTFSPNATSRTTPARDATRRSCCGGARSTAARSAPPSTTATPSASSRCGSMAIT